MSYNIGTTTRRTIQYASIESSRAYDICRDELKQPAAHVAASPPDRLSGCMLPELADAHADERNGWLLGRAEAARTLNGLIGMLNVLMERMRCCSI